MPYELLLALRYLKGLQRSQPFVSVIAGISVLGVAVGVAALLVVLGVMSGFDADLQAKIIGANPHLVVQTEGGMAEVDLLLEKIKRLPSVKAAAPFIQTEVLLRFEDQATGAILKGIDPVREADVTGLVTSMKKGDWPPPPGGIIIGSELARRLRIFQGDTLTVVSGQNAKPYPMPVVGIFSTGMYEYDVHLVIGELTTVQQILGLAEEGGPSAKKEKVRIVPISGIGVRLESAEEAQEVKGILQQQLGFPYWVVSWVDLNRNLFAALKLEKVTMFVILTLIVLVACFNIIATLLMVVVEKTKEIGILKAIGATNRSVRKIFTWTGLIIGLMGTATGTICGLGLCIALKKYQFIQLPPEIYYIDHLPVLLQSADALAVIVCALVISWAACLYPAWVAARMQPAEAVRYE